jgi:hypothetical protein
VGGAGAPARAGAQRRLFWHCRCQLCLGLLAAKRKADGNVLKVDRAQIFAQAPPGSPQAPMFTDRKQKVIVFPDVGPDDLVVFTIKWTRTRFPRAGSSHYHPPMAACMPVTDFSFFTLSKRKGLDRSSSYRSFFRLIEGRGYSMWSVP